MRPIEFKIEFEQRRVFIRPTLRAALRLHREYDGLHHLLTALMQGSLKAIGLVVMECSERTSDRTRLMSSLIGKGKRLPVNTILATLQAPCLECAMAMLGLDDKAEGDHAAAGKPISFEEHIGQLYRIATGFLHWDRDAAWNATAVEILEAREGWVEKQQAIWGRKEDGEGSEPAPISAYDDTVDHEGIATLKAMSRRKAKAPPQDIGTEQAIAFLKQKSAERRAGAA